MNPSPTTNDAPWTIARLLTWTTEFLTRQGVDDPRLASEVLLANAAGWRRIDLYARFEKTLDPEPLAKFRAWVKRAADHEPIAYLVGQREFFSLPFSVSADVLIPRPESETLVEALVDQASKSGWAEPRILDVGTGSGCLIIAALVQLKTARGVGSDVSEAALSIARGNAERNRIADRVEFVLADRLALPAGFVPEGGFQAIVCNPPYIPQESVATLDRAVKDFEPGLALTDGGDGLSFYRNLAAEGSELLAPDGRVVVEVADGQATAVAQIMTAKGVFALQRVRKDAVVGQERALVFARNASR